MRTFLTGTAVLLTLTMAFSSAVSGQEYLRKEQLKTIRIEKSSPGKLIDINVTDEYNYLKIWVQGKFEKGDVHIEIMDPKGEVKKDFSIKSGKVVSHDGKTITGVIEGEMESVCRNPLKGKWTVRATTKNSEGDINVYCLLILNPKTDLIEPEQIEEDTDSHLRL